MNGAPLVFRVMIGPPAILNPTHVSTARHGAPRFGGVQTWATRLVATKKKPPVWTECEVKVRGRWLPCTLYED